MLGVHDAEVAASVAEVLALPALSFTRLDDLESSGSCIYRMPCRLV